MYRILVLGGYGNFGARISKSLAAVAHIQLFIAGRDLDKANKLVAELNDSRHMALTLDQESDQFTKELADLDIDCLIHTSGPYQGLSYTVAEACVNTNTHYIDLSDGRKFVAGFTRLNKTAKEKNVLLITGASTLPGLSSAVIKRFREEFPAIESIRICISPGNKAPRGESTIAAVLSYCGKPIKTLIDGKWQFHYGWQDLHFQTFPRLGKRLLGACEVPDLDILPEKYPAVKTVVFHAALETSLAQLAFWLMAVLSRSGLVSDPSKYAGIITKLGRLVDFMGTPDGGMFIKLSGRDDEGCLKELSWYLTALNAHGPEIPGMPAIILAKKLAKNELTVTGAMPCFELITLAEFDEEFKSYDISWEVVRH